MRTATAPHPRQTAARVLAGAVGAALGAGVVLAAVGLVVHGSAAGAGALVAAVLATFVLAFGAMAVDVVAGARPAASLLVAMLTYVLQVSGLLVLVALVIGSARFDNSFANGWFAAGIIAAAAGWTVAQVWLSLRARIPLYDLSEAGAR